LADNEQMAMTEMTVGEQTIRYDPEATAAIYARLRNGWAHFEWLLNDSWDSDSRPAVKKAPERLV